MTEKTFNVLFLCTHNSARSILAEALLNHLGRGRFKAFSAGSSPRANQQPNPLGLQVLQSAGVSTEGLHSKSWDEFGTLAAQKMDLVITVCDNAAGEVCPYWPGQPATAHWGYADPSAGDADDAHKREAFRQTMLALKRRLELLMPMAIALGVVGLLLLAEPDMGAFIVIALIAVGILFLGGVNGKVFAIMIATLLGALLSIIWLSPIRWERIKAFWNPWDEANAMGKAYQLTHSLIAFGRGEVFGQGLGQSVEKLHYLPEAHTDFLLAVIGEELGFIGVAVVIVAFFWLTRRIFMIGRQAVAMDRIFAGLMVQGIGIWMGGQTLINMGVNLGALPTKGLTLPLLSYGGSAILMNMIALAIVVRVDVENRQLMRGGRA